MRHKTIAFRRCLPAPTLTLSLLLLLLPLIRIFGIALHTSSKHCNAIKYQKRAERSYFGLARARLNCIGKWGKETHFCVCVCVSLSLSRLPTCSGSLCLINICCVYRSLTGLLASLLLLFYISSVVILSFQIIGCKYSSPCRT